MYQRYIDELSVCTTLNDVRMIGNDVCTQYGFDRFIYSLRLPFSLTSPEYLVMDSAEKQRRTTMSMRESLPGNIQQPHVALPVVWQKRVRSDSSGTSKSLYSGKLSVFDMLCGLSIPVHTHHSGTALIAYITAREDIDVTRDIDRALPELCLIASHKHEAINRLVDMTQFKPQLGKISKREQECIRWSAEGLTTTAIAEKLCISESTVTFHLQNAMRKLDAKNRQQVVARAIMMGAV